MENMHDRNRDYLQAQYELCLVLAGRLLTEPDGRRLRPGLSVPGRCPDSGDEKSREVSAQQAREKIDLIVTEVQASGGSVPFDEIATANQLSTDEQTILMLLFFSRQQGRSLKGMRLLEVIAGQSLDWPARANILAPGATLRGNGLIEIVPEPFMQRGLLLEQEFRITGPAFWTISGAEGWEDFEDGGSRKQPRPEQIIEVRDPRVTFDQLVLEPEILEKIDDVLWLAANANAVYQDYGLASRITYGKGITMLFHGTPGTGKTATAEAIAHKLGKKIGVARYDQINDMFIGESEKNLVAAFREAGEQDCVLLFDEADALFGRRLTEIRSTDRLCNTLTNLLMQQVENYTGVVILTTNRQTAIDKAFERRLLLKLEFPEPGPKARAAIWRSLLAGCPRLADDVDFEELGRILPMSGGKIRSAVQRAVSHSARAGSEVDFAVLVSNASQTTASRDNTRRIGFQTV